jgi:hypothetical protein
LATAATTAIVCGTVFPQEKNHDPEKPQQMKLWKEIEIAAHSGTFPCPGDLDNDGRVDFLLYRQGPKTTVEVSHGQGVWAGNSIDDEPGNEVIILRSGHRGDFTTLRGSDGAQPATFQQRQALEGYPDFPCVVN